MFHLCQLGDPAKAALPELKSLLQDTSHPLLRMKAARVIAESAPEERQFVLPILIEGIDDADESVVQQAAFGLETLGPDAVAVVPHLKGLLERSVGFVCISLAGALISITSEEHDFVLPMLTKILQQGDERVHNFVIDLLGDIGPQAISSVPLLHTFLSVEYTAQSTSIALGKITGDWTAAFDVGVRLFRSPESLYDFVPREHWESFGFEAQTHWEMLGIHACDGISCLEAEREMATEPVRTLIEGTLKFVRGLCRRRP